MSRGMETRITELEVQLAHTQHLVDQLNQVMTDQATKMDRMTRVLSQLQQGFEELKFKTDEKRDLLDEKPPHY